MFYRIVQRDEQTDIGDAGYPSPEQSDQEGEEREGENQEEGGDGENQPDQAETLIET